MGQGIRFRSAPYHYFSVEIRAPGSREEISLRFKGPTASIDAKATAKATIKAFAEAAPAKHFRVAVIDRETSEIRLDVSGVGVEVSGLFK